MKKNSKEYGDTEETIEMLTQNKKNYEKRLKAI